MGTRFSRKDAASHWREKIQGTSVLWSMVIFLPMTFWWGAFTNEWTTVQPPLWLLCVSLALLVAAFVLPIFVGRWMSKTRSYYLKYLKYELEFQIDMLAFWKDQAGISENLEVESRQAMENMSGLESERILLIETHKVRVREIVRRLNELPEKEKAFLNNVLNRENNAVLDKLLEIGFKTAEPPDVRYKRIWEELLKQDKVRFSRYNLRLTEQVEILTTLTELIKDVESQP